MIKTVIMDLIVYEETPRVNPDVVVVWTICDKQGRAGYISTSSGQLIPLRLILDKSVARRYSGSGKRAEEEAQT